MKLIVGLGNPGNEYTQTRHNMGFLVIDKILNDLNLSLKVDIKLQSAYVKTKIGLEDVVFAKPLTYMNLSGNAVSSLMSYYKINIEDIIIISDDLALEQGKIRLRASGSHGGQNGLRDIALKLSSDKYKRIRIGIGRHEFATTSDYVLGRITKDELTRLIPAIEIAADAIQEWVKFNNFDKIMTKYNTPQTK